MSGLKVCPFCGEKGTVISNLGRPEGERQMFHAACNNYRCGAYGGLAWRETAEKAIELWDRWAEAALAGKERT